MRTFLLLVCSALAVSAEVVDLSSSLDRARAERLVGEHTYQVWNAGMAPEDGTMTVRGRREGDGYLIETSIQVPDESSGFLFVGEALALGKDLRPTGYARTNHLGEVEISKLELSWSASNACLRVGKNETLLDAATLPDAVVPHWLTLLALDPGRAYRTTTLSFAERAHDVAALLRCEGTQELGGKPCARWALRFVEEDATSEMKWWVDSDGVVAFRCGAYQGVRKGVAPDALPLDGDLDPSVTFRMTPAKADERTEVRRFHFEDATYRRGTVVGMKTQYSVEECTHGHVMVMTQGDRVVALLRHFSLGNPTQLGDEWSVTLALSLPGLEANRTYDLGAGVGEGILHYGSQGPQAELISRQATGQVKVLKVEGPTIELELSLTFEGQVAGADLGVCRFDVQGTVEAGLAE